MRRARGRAIRAKTQRRLLASCRIELGVLRAVLLAPSGSPVADGYGGVGSICLIPAASIAPLDTPPGNAEPAGQR
jgi:hypothetical protein